MSGRPVTSAARPLIRSVSLVAWDQEIEADVRIPQDVLEGIHPAISYLVGKHHGLFVENANEPGQVAARR